METTCTRCHQAIPADGLYCPSCGLPQLTYGDEEASVPAQAGSWTEAVRDPGTVEWKPALKAALLLAIPAGLLSGGVPVMGIFGLFWMGVAAAWAVAIYARSQKQAAQHAGWITAGAGARIGLVTGLAAGWVSFAASAVSLFAKRFLFHQGNEFDSLYQDQVAKVSEQWQAASAASQDAQAAALFKSAAAWLLTPEGRVGTMLGGLLTVEVILVVCATAGGALGAKLMVKQGTRE